MEEMKSDWQYSRWIQEGLVGARLRHHHCLGPQDSRENSPGEPQAAHVIRPGNYKNGRVKKYDSRNQIRKFYSL